MFNVPISTKSNELAFNSSMTRKRPIEICALNILSCKSLSTCKSWKNSHILTLYAGKKCEGSVETYNTMKVELESIFAAIEEFHKSLFITIDDQKYYVDLFICLDLACLACATKLETSLYNKEEYCSLVREHSLHLSAVK